MASNHISDRRIDIGADFYNLQLLHRSVPESAALAPYNVSSIDSGAALDGYLLTSDGAGNSVWEAAPAASEVNDLTAIVTWASQWGVVKTVSFTLAVQQRFVIDATAADVTATLPGTIAVADEFIVHNASTSTFDVFIDPGTHDILGPADSVLGGTDTLILAIGETARLVAVSTTELEVV